VQEALTCARVHTLAPGRVRPASAIAADPGVACIAWPVAPAIAPAIDADTGVALGWPGCEGQINEGHTGTHCRQQGAGHGVHGQDSICM
jgi:hypothetical protein